MLITFALKLERVGFDDEVWDRGDPNIFLSRYASGPFAQTRQTLLEKVGELTFSGFTSTKSHR